MAKNIIASNNLESYKKKYGKSLSKGKLSSFSKKEIENIYGKDNNSTYIINKNKKFELIGDTYYERPNHKKKIIILSSCLAVAAGGATIGHFVATNPNVGIPTVITNDGNLLISGDNAKKGSSYTGTIQVPTEKQSTKVLPYVVKEVRTGNKVLNSKVNNSEDNYYTFDRHNDVAGKIYIHRTEGPIQIVIELNDRGKATRVEKVEVISSKTIVDKNETIHLNAKVYPETSTNKEVSWKVVNENGAVSSLATINRFGDLTAGKKQGKAYVIAISNDGHIESKPFEILIGDPAKDVGYDYNVIDGSTNVTIHKNNATVGKESLDLSKCPDNYNILSIEPIYEYKKDFYEGAFEGLTNLKSVTLPKTVNAITKNCFKNCTALEEITIPANIRGIDESAFEGCTSLKRVIFEEGSQLQAIEQRAFFGCSNLKEFEVPASIDTIGSCAFAKSGLQELAFKTQDDIPFINNDKKEVKISEITAKYVTDYDEESKKGTAIFDLVLNSDSYQSVTVNDFYYPNCYIKKNQSFKTEISNLKIPSHMIENKYSNVLYRVSQISYEGFCKENYETVEFPYCLEMIGSGAFYGCEKLNSVHLCSNIKTVCQDAFRNCHAIKKLQIDEGVQILQNDAFNISDCSPQEGVPFQSLILPSSIKTIGERCFKGRSSSLTNVVFKDNNDDWYVTYSTDGYRDLNKDESGDFEYFHFKNEDNSDINANYLTVDKQNDNGYVEYQFIKNTIHQAEYDWGFYLMHQNLGAYENECVKTGVTYTYLFDFTNKEIKDIASLRFSVNLLESDYSLKVDSIQITDGEKIIDESSAFNAKIDEINKNKFIDFSSLKEKYEKIYVYIKYKAQQGSDINLSTSNGSFQKQLIPDRSYVSSFRASCEIVNTDSENRVHRYGSAYESNRIEVTSSSQIVEYRLACNELKFKSNLKSYSIVFNLCNENNNNFYDIYCSASDVNVSHPTATTTVNKDNLENGWFTIEFGREVPTTAELTIRVTYNTKCKSNDKFYITTEVGNTLA